MSARPLPVAFLSDFGDADEYTGACRLVLARLAPEARTVDITHAIAPGDVRRGALALEAASLRAGPAVYLAVVDPGVGSERRALALRCGASFLVGPDNGLLAPAAQALGGIDEAVDVSASPLRLEPVARTFHGRDLFAPVAAHLAAGRPLATAGEPLEPPAIATLPLPAPAIDGPRATLHVLYADRFGNLVLDARSAELELAAELELETATGRFRARAAPTFAAVGEGELAVYPDSSGRLGIAVNRGSAAALLGLGRDDQLGLRPR